MGESNKSKSRLCPMFKEPKTMRAFIILLLLFLGVSFRTFAQNEGETIFKSTCSACHKASNERLVGPGLANVHKKRTEEWFINFVKSSQGMVKKGDPDAVAIFEEFNKTVMPDQNLTDAQIKSVLAYIVENSPAEADATAATTDSKAPAQAAAARVATAEDIVAGQNLFMGKTKFANGGATCNSCHHVKNDNVLAGGALAKDLTDAYGRLTADGVKGILGAPPFPAMKQAFQNNPLTEDEIFKLTAFMQSANDEQGKQHPVNYGRWMLSAGLIGAFMLMGVYPALWFRRKKRTVNTRIYNRQVKSNN